ncbi:hypothetical protein AZ28_1470 [Bordetella pertussis B200]|nr:hypothetical protein AZ28_1470 [Bordetella pertussis B200]
MAASLARATVAGTACSWHGRFAIAGQRPRWRVEPIAVEHGHCRPGRGVARHAQQGRQIACLAGRRRCESPSRPLGRCAGAPQHRGKRALLPRGDQARHLPGRRPQGDGGRPSLGVGGIQRQHFAARKQRHGELPLPMRERDIQVDKVAGTRRRRQARQLLQRQGNGPLPGLELFGKGRRLFRVAQQGCLQGLARLHRGAQHRAIEPGRLVGQQGASRQPRLGHVADRDQFVVQRRASLEIERSHQAGNHGNARLLLDVVDTPLYVFAGRPCRQRPGDQREGVTAERAQALAPSRRPHGAPPICSSRMPHPLACNAGCSDRRSRPCGPARSQVCGAPQRHAGPAAPCRRQPDARKRASRRTAHRAVTVGPAARQCQTCCATETGPSRVATSRRRRACGGSSTSANGCRLGRPRGQHSRAATPSTPPNCGARLIVWVQSPAPPASTARPGSTVRSRSSA